jgi:hypothetical protein
MWSVAITLLEINPPGLTELNIGLENGSLGLTEHPGTGGGYVPPGVSGDFAPF